MGRGQLVQRHLELTEPNRKPSLTAPATQADSVRVRTAAAAARHPGQDAKRLKALDRGNEEARAAA